MLLYCMNFINKKILYPSDDKRSIGKENSPDKMSSSGFDPVIINSKGEQIDVVGDTTMGSFQRISPTGEYTE